MLNKFKQLFEAAASDQNEQQSDQLAKRAATALLLELSRSDHDVSAQETQTIISVATNTFGISNNEIETWLTDAGSHADQATSLYEFTELINQYFGKDQKYELIVNMWRVAFADGRIDRYEDHLIRKVAELIYVSHSAFIRAKHEVGVAL
jgi:uncharacterized tellurite resistance protein B-like protein